MTIGVFVLGYNLMSNLLSGTCLGASFLDIWGKDVIQDAITIQFYQLGCRTVDEQGHLVLDAGCHR